jgi:amino acid transporter
MPYVINSFATNSAPPTPAIDVYLFLQPASSPRFKFESQERENLVSAADYAWWQLLLVILGAIVACFILGGMGPRSVEVKNNSLTYLFASLVWICILAGIISLVFAIINFVKWMGIA